MKIILLSLFVILSISGFSQKKESLFNGKDLKGWTVYVPDSTIKSDAYFYVTDGVIETPGVPMGYLRTKKEYKNYRLHIEWRYPGKPTNSGIFLHTTGPDKLWPAHYQCQLKHLSAGDLIVHGEGLTATVRDSTYTSTPKIKPIASKTENPSENKPGEWNSYDIVCKGNTIEVKVNGVLQNFATNCNHTSGGIGLQAEGSTIQFRNLWIQKIK